MESISQFFAHFLEPNLHTALLVVLNLILIESLLSVDNAAVLATMVMDLPHEQRKRALRIGIIFAYIFRGAALIFASYLIKINWLKFAGGAYLLYLTVTFFSNKYFGDKETGEDALQPKQPQKFLFLNQFWTTVAMVEAMDIIFSVDNVFAAVAFTNNIYLICLGVFIGIVTMRIVAGYFVKLMERFPFLDTVAFVVIGILGARLCFDFFCVFMPGNTICEWLHHKNADMYFSIFTATVFFLPILSSLVLDFPKRKM